MSLWNIPHGFPLLQVDLGHFITWAFELSNMFQEIESLSMHTKP
jgi:hypothetical protein